MVTREPANRSNYSPWLIGTAVLSLLVAAPARAGSLFTHAPVLTPGGRYGSADFFFAYRAEVCAAPAREGVRDTSVSGITLEGGVGE